MGFLARLFGVSRTKPPTDPFCWTFAAGRLEVDLGKAPELKDAGAFNRDLPDRG